MECVYHLSNLAILFGMSRFFVRTSATHLAQEQLPPDDQLAAASLKDKLQLCAQGPQSVGGNLI